jgi:hydroxylaminobenzene mutase
VQTIGRRLLWHGMALFLLGLLTGLAEQHFSNVRMGLAAHLEGLMNGTFLLALGGSWTQVRLSAAFERMAFATVLAGTYGNWATTTLAAVTGTAALSPITAAGRGAPAWQETLVMAGFVSVGILMPASSCLVLWGLRRRAGKGAPVRMSRCYYRGLRDPSNVTTAQRCLRAASQIYFGPVSLRIVFTAQSLNS